jgi:hypothetical protein
MRGLYPSLLALHVVVAVLGLGLIAAVAVVAATARRAGRGLTDVAAWLTPLLRFSAISLGVMLATGALLDFAVGGAFNQRWWFRGSALLLVATGVLHARARSALRTVPASGGGDAALRRVERIAYGMCLLIAVIVVLMEAKPF